MITTTGMPEGVWFAEVTGTFSPLEPRSQLLGGPHLRAEPSLLQKLGDRAEKDTFTQVAREVPFAILGSLPSQGVPGPLLAPPF